MVLVVEQMTLCRAIVFAPLDNYPRARMSIRDATS